MQKVLIAGGTGLVGSNLIEKLKQKKYTVILLTTQKAKANGIDVFYWQPYANELPKEALIGVSVCINLCGAGIFDKNFTTERKQELRDSRIISAKVLYNSFKQNNINLKCYIGASASGYYPNITNDILTESREKGNWFISKLVADWEKAHFEFEDITQYVMAFRIGIVLSNKGGFLKQLSTPIKYYIGSIIGSGKQTISWVHISDLTDMMLWGIENNLKGVFNAVASSPTSLQTLTKLTAKALHRPLLLPNIPEFMLKIIFGKRAPLLLSSQNVSNAKICNTGFTFKYSNADEAIDNLLLK